MKTVRFHPDAEAEMIAAAAYYERQQADLGRHFLASVQDAINRIVMNPALYGTVELDIQGVSRGHSPSASSSGFGLTRF